MYINSHRASRLRKKMNLVYGKDKTAKVHSLISRKLFDQHEADFRDFKRVSGVWISESKALIAYK